MEGLSYTMMLYMKKRVRSPAEHLWGPGFVPEGGGGDQEDSGILSAEDHLKSTSLCCCF